MSKLQGKTALVTGASKGIGAGIAKELAASGAAVLVNYATDRIGAEAVVATITTAGGRAVAIPGDVSKASDVGRLFEQTKAAFGALDVLVNNAGVYQPMPLVELTAEEFHREINTNLFGPLLTIRESLKHFGPDGGSIINLGSAVSRMHPPGYSVYSASKAGLDAVTGVLAKELAPRKIRGNRRIDQTRWPDAETVDDWNQGAPLAKVKALVDHWRHRYDWRRCEAMLNDWGQYKTTIDGLDIHFLHVRSKHENALPLIITHGWPGSVIEFMKIIGPLTDPTAHGGRPEDAFHVVAPSLPGHGFSDKPTATGWDVPRIANAWIVLMRRLGYTRWVAQGGDWGSLVATAIGVMKPDDCAAIHVNMPLVFPEPDQLQDMDAFEQAAVASLAHWEEKGSGYFKQQSTRPQTLGYGLADSPVGQAAWIYEKMWAWTDNQGNPEDALTLDEMLDNIMLYWLPGNATSSARLYWESVANVAPTKLANVASTRLELPVGVSIYPRETNRPSRRWVDRWMPNLIHYNILDRGGHFAAWEQPALHAKEIRDCFAKVR